MFWSLLCNLTIKQLHTCILFSEKLNDLIISSEKNTGTWEVNKTCCLTFFCISQNYSTSTLSHTDFRMLTRVNRTWNWFWLVSTIFQLCQVFTQDFDIITSPAVLTIAKRTYIPFKRTQRSNPPFPLEASNSIVTSELTL